VKAAKLLSGQGCVLCLVQCRVLNGTMILEENFNLVHPKETEKLS
jgi:hypothetical protein